MSCPPLITLCRDNDLGLETGAYMAGLLALNPPLACLDLSLNPLVGSIGVESLSGGLRVSVLGVGRESPALGPGPAPRPQIRFLSVEQMAAPVFIVCARHTIFCRGSSAQG